MTLWWGKEKSLGSLGGVNTSRRSGPPSETDLFGRGTLAHIIILVPDRPTVAVLHGDQTGEELLLEARRLMAKDVIGLEVATRDFDLSLANRRETRNEVVREAAAALREGGFGIKAATVTPEGAGDVGSPNGAVEGSPRQAKRGMGNVGGRARRALDGALDLRLP